MRLARSVRLSARALLAHRARAALAVASVGAGVAAVVLARAVGAGVEGEVRARVEAVGLDLLVVRAAEVPRSPARPELRGPATSLRLDDWAAIGRLPAVAHAAPAAEAPVRVKAGGAAMATRMLGTTAEYPAVRRFRVARGRFLTVDDDRAARRVVVLGARVADELFAGDPVGRELRLQRIPFQVVGVLAPRGALADGDEDNQVLVPVRTALRRVTNRTALSAIFVRVRDPAALRAAEAEVAARLAARHRPARDGRPDFEVQHAAAGAAMQRATADSLRTLTAGIAAVALGLGGSGVMALMLLSVRERTAEIGLRVAVGARPRYVVVQFLLESTALALVGWASGLALGLAGAAAVAAGTRWPAAASADGVWLSLGVALAAGLVFGAVPARRAARVPPLRALRTR